MSRLGRTVAERLIRWRRVLLVCAAVAALAAIWPASQLDFDRSIENMFAADDALLAPYRMLKRVFGGNEIVLAVYRDEHFLDQDFSGVRRLGQIRERLAQVPGVKGVLSLDMLMGESVVRQDNSLAVRFRELFNGYTHGSDGTTVAVVCMLLPEAETEVPRRQTIDELRRVMDGLPDGLSPGMLAGEPVMVTDGFRYVEKDGKRLGITSTVLLAITIVLCFRSLRWVLIPIAVVQLALWLTRAVLSVGNLRLSMVSSMLTAIVTVVGVATVVHVVVRFREARLSGAAPREAILRALTLLIVPIFWACFTDAVGFASLLVADVGPVQDFGIMMAVGSLMVLVSAILVVPGMALLGEHWDAGPRLMWGERGLGAVLNRTIGWVRRSPRFIAWFTVILTVAATAGVFRLEIETDFTKNFRAGSPIVKSYDMVETRLGGAGVCDVILPAPGRLDWQYLSKVLRLEQRLRDEAVVSGDKAAAQPGLTKVISLADAVVAAAPFDPGSLPSRFLRDRAVRVGLAGMHKRIPLFFEALYGKDPNHPHQSYFRIMLRARERQPSHVKRQLIAQLRQISREEFPEAEVTGFYVLLTYLIDSIIRDQWLAFCVATAGIGCMMLVAFRSVSLALVALVPNIVPILVVMGVMGWLGLRINMGAAMIAAVSMGLSIDSSIHYITSFRRARSEGMSLFDALDAVQQSVGRAVVFSTLALIVGFSVLCTSQFIPTVYFGLLVSVSMLGGLAGNLLVLPLLLAWTQKTDKSRTPRSRVSPRLGKGRRSVC